MVRFKGKNITSLINDNIALLLAPILTSLSILLYNIASLLKRHHPQLMHVIVFAVSAAILFGLFYAVLSYMRILADEDEDSGEHG